MMLPPGKLRIFFSADLVGATAYKHSSMNAETADQASSTPVSVPDLTEQLDVQPWANTLNSLYDELPEHFEMAWISVWTEFSELIPDFECYGISREGCPRVWKTIGDEVVFFGEVHHFCYALMAVSAFKNALNAYRPDLYKKSTNLDIRGTAWLAGFPINNAEIVLGRGADRYVREKLAGRDTDLFYRHFLKVYYYYNERKPEGGDFLDFIGPQIDLGFRLASRSTPRKCFMPVDLVLALCNAHDDLERMCTTPVMDALNEIVSFESSLKFDGTAQLKGILGGTPYPMIWLDIKPDKLLNDAEDSLNATTSNNNIKDYRKYAREFIRKYGASTNQTEDDSKKTVWLHEPYICQQTSTGTLEVRTIEGEIPQSHIERLKIISDRWQATLREVSSEMSDAEMDDENVAREDPEDRMNMIAENFLKFMGASDENRE